MKLKDWLTKEERSQTWLARKLLKSEATVYFWVTGKSTPTGKTAAEIVSLTKGEVTFADLYSEYIDQAASKYPPTASPASLPVMAAPEAA